MAPPGALLPAHPPSAGAGGAKALNRFSIYAFTITWIDAPRSASPGCKPRRFSAAGSGGPLRFKKKSKPEPVPIFPGPYPVVMGGVEGGIL